MKKTKSRKPQPKPNKNRKDLPNVVNLVLKDIKERDRLGVKRYGEHLQPFNGRDQLWDSYEEILDLTQYFRALIYERDGE